MFYQVTQFIWSQGFFSSFSLDPGSRHPAYKETQKSTHDAVKGCQVMSTFRFKITQNTITDNRNENKYQDKEKEVA